ncbi:hypothetical protein ABZ464_40725 [Streptomyces sp. NPDC005820]|uniref:hypothetical protein n=1 Tax=Streptomyces sp. NPDC005820 TaxID=3157069 RepID=UPI0033D84A3E
MPDDDLLEAARAIRPYLEELVGEDAAAYDGALGRLLADAHEGLDVDAPLSALLSSNEDISVWIGMVRHDPLRRPPEHQPIRGYGDLPGPGEPVSAERYVCPGGDFVWYRPTAGVPVPACPDHGAVLKPN